MKKVPGSVRDLVRGPCDPKTGNGERRSSLGRYVRGELLERSLELRDARSQKGNRRGSESYEAETPPGGSCC